MSGNSWRDRVNAGEVDMNDPAVLEQHLHELWLSNTMQGDDPLQNVRLLWDHITGCLERGQYDRTEIGRWLIGLNQIDANMRRWADRVGETLALIQNESPTNSVDSADGSSERVLSGREIETQAYGRKPLQKRYKNDADSGWSEWQPVNLVSHELSDAYEAALTASRAATNHQRPDGTSDSDHAIGLDGKCDACDRDIYVSLDVETTGAFPGMGDLATIGAVAIDGETLDTIGTFYVRLVAPHHLRDRADMFDQWDWAGERMTLHFGEGFKVQYRVML